MSRLEFTIEARQARWLHDGRDEMGPQYYNSRTIKVFSDTEEHAMQKAEQIYGHKDTRNLPDVDDWVEMDITKVEEKL